MLIKKSYCYRIEPSKKDPEKVKFTWVGNVFKVARDYGNESVHPKLRITENQGVCGKAFREGKETNKNNIIGDVLLPELDGVTNYNFTKKQRKLTEGLVIVVSCPLIIKVKEGDIQKTKKIGVFNVESKIDDSALLFADKEDQDKFYEKIANLSNIFITLHV